MLNNEFLKDLSSRISRLVPMAAAVREDVEKSIHDVLQGAFSRLNLVTRDEFDAQSRVLKRAEETIAALEEKVAALEQSRNVKSPPATDTETR